MPGMLDTVLDVGCTPAAVHGLVRMTGQPHFAWDCRRRFLESYACVVLGMKRDDFAASLAEVMSAEGVADEAALDGAALESLALAYQRLIEDEDVNLPEDPVDQLVTAAEAVFRSWTSERATTYRRLQHLEDLQGTAVTIQTMVFGNSGLTSGAGVAFTRDPSTGAATPIIDALFDSQGEDVVSGSRTPETDAAIARRAPAAAKELREILTRLEREFGDVQDVEFTIENGKLWILQTRAAKRTPLAALRFAIDFVKEGLITPAQALQQRPAMAPCTLARKRLVDPPAPAARGTGSSAGVATGRAAFDSVSAQRMAADGGPVILVRPDTSTADIAGFAAAAGIVTAVGGRTAHAALVARQMGKPSVVGCTSLSMDAAHRGVRINGTAIKEGDWLSIDGEAGAVYLGRYDCVTDRPEAELAELARWRADTAVLNRAS
jgi:pyruvate,orthophosphate dikinase